MDDPASLPTEACFEHAPCALLVMDAHATLVRCNATLGQWLGYDPEQLKHRSLDQLLTAIGRTFRLTQWGPLLDQQGSVSEVKVALRHRDGHQVAMLLNAVRRETPEGVRYHLALFGTTERDRNEQSALQAMQRAEELLAQKISAERALRQAQDELAAAYADAQRRALLAEHMVAVASHDLKNPITAIRMASDLLDRHVQDDRGRQLLSGIGSSVDRAQRMIVDLLDFAAVRLGQGIGINRQSLDLAELVSDCVGEFRLAFPAARIRMLSRGRGLFDVDRDRLQQMLGNLVANSVAYGDLGHPITVTTDLSGEKALLAVHNHGHCIDEALLPVLFEPMARGSDKQNPLPSIGLGLFIVKMIAEAHGGRVSMTSRRVYGTTFVIELPSLSSLVQGSASLGLLDPC